MRFLFLVSLFALPILDIASLIEVGSRIGVWPTVAAVILSAIAGGLLVRTQGVTILQQARTALAALYQPLDRPQCVDALTICRQPDRDGPFRVLSRHPLLSAA